MKSFMQKWSTACQKNPVIAVVSLPFIVLFAAVTAVWLFLKGDKRYKRCL